MSQTFFWETPTSQKVLNSMNLFSIVSLLLHQTNKAGMYLYNRAREFITLKHALPAPAD